MSIDCFLAMTAAEFSSAPVLPNHIAWMACHFSVYGTGLTNLPDTLPPGSLVIVNDRIPFHRHDPGLIADQLLSLKERLDISGFLLDVQREPTPQVRALTEHLVERLDVPAGVSEGYAADLPCPVLVSPPPLLKQLSTCSSPWVGREIWLEAAVEAGVFRIGKEGGTYTPLPYSPPAQPLFYEDALQCHYHISLPEKAVEFTFYRQPEDIPPLLQRADALGITRAVGLYQQLKTPEA